MGSEKSLKTVCVRILDQELTFQSDAPIEKVKEVENYLNQELAEILAKTKNTPPYKAVILAALNITEKYLNSVDGQNAFKKDVAERSKRILGMLDV